MCQPDSLCSRRDCADLLFVLRETWLAKIQFSAAHSLIWPQLETSVVLVNSIFCLFRTIISQHDDNLNFCAQED